MKKLIPVLVLFFSVNVFAQNADAEKNKNWLKKNLVKEVYNITSVKIEGCKISLKEGYTRVFTGYSLERNNAQMGTFPMDDASNYLSAGAGATGGFYRKQRLVSFDLADLNVDSISTAKSSLKGKTAIILETKDEKNLIEFKDKSNSSNRKNFEFVVKNKLTQRFVDNFKDAIKNCQ